MRKNLQILDEKNVPSIKSLTWDWMLDARKENMRGKKKQKLKVVARHDEPIRRVILILNMQYIFYRTTLNYRKK